MPVSKRVVVTGLGVVSPIGIGADVFWKAALAGRSIATLYVAFLNPSQRWNEPAIS